MPKTNRRILFFVSLLFSVHTFGQLDHQYWHFGSTNRGLFFDASNSYAVTVTTNSYTPYGNEGSTVVSDPLTGALQFYSDAMTVVDNTHQAMPNGTGLMGHSSNYSSGKACQVPGQCSQYYVFSVNTALEVGTPGALRYSIVDMSLPGNGTIPFPQGDVVAGQKNILIANDVSESLEVIPKANSHDFWLLVGKQGINSIDIYSITAGGITFSSTYAIPIVMDNIVCMDHCQQNGKIALLSYQEMYPTLIADFDNAAGNFTAVSSIPGTPWGASSLLWQGTFDSEWSPDGTKLYLSKYRWGATAGGRLYQYDLNTPLVPPVMIHSVGTSNSAVARGIKLAPDGKIYMMWKPATGAAQFLHVVNDPNNPGAACNFVTNAVNMGIDLGITHLFPDFLYYQNSIPQIPDSTINFTCQIPTTFSFDPLSGYTDNESDNLSFSVNSVLGGTVNVIGSTLDFTTDPAFIGNPEIEIIYQDDFCFALSDTFTVTLTASAGTGTLAMPDSIATCIGNTITLDAGIGFTSYDWSTGEITQTIDVSATGMYSVETTDGVCIYLDSTYVEFNGPTPVSLGPDQTICADSLQLSIGAFSGIVNWSDGATGNSNWVINSGQYSVIAENSSGCLSYDTVDVTINPLPVIDLGSDQQLCNGDQIYLIATGYNSVLWSDASTNDSLLVSSSGNYSVMVSNLFLCNATDDLTITFNTPVQINLGPDLIICDTDALLATSGFSGTVTWSDGATGNTNLVFNSGEYSVIGDDLNGCESFDTINVFLAPIPTINLGSDTLICPDDFYLVASGFPTVLWSTSETSDSILITTGGLYSVEVITSFGCQASDQISIDILDPTVIDLGPDFETCNQDKVILSTGLETGIFSWSTEESTSSITVTESGSYYVTQQVCNVSIVDSIRVDISTLDQTVYIPNAFTPDGNTLNPVFEVVFGDYSHVLSYKLLIYNRWGQLVFETTDPYEFWNGTGVNGLVQDGVYTYVVKIETDCDENSVWVKTGHVTVLK